MIKWIGLVVCLAGLCQCVPNPLDFSYITYKKSAESDSSEYGQSKGVKANNCTCGWTNKDSGRIVGGRETLVNEYPYMTGIGYLEKGSVPRVMATFCGGAIVTPHHVITAAHCTYDDHDSQLGIVVGAHNVNDNLKHRRVYKVDETKEHPGWSDRTYENDVAILVIKTPIEFNQWVGPICLPHKNTFPKGGIVGQHIRVTGWGDTAKNGDSSDVLLKVSLKVLDTKFCVENYPTKPITSKQLCTYSYQKDSCQGDSGGPLAWLDSESNRYTLAAVVSYGSGCASLKPGVNTDVLAFMDWIQKTISVTAPRPVKTCAKL